MRDFNKFLVDPVAYEEKSPYEQADIQLGDLNPFDVSLIRYGVRNYDLINSSDRRVRRRATRNLLLLGAYDAVNGAAELSVYPWLPFVKLGIGIKRLVDFDSKQKRQRELETVTPS